MNIHEILKKMPHRFPFIMIDKVISLEPNKKIVAIKNVTVNEQYFMGHFPENPVMPGVLIIEAMAQTGLLLARQMMENETENDDKVYVFAGIDKVRFRKVVLPGDQLELHVEFVKRRGDIWKMNGIAKVKDNVVCSAELTSAKTRVNNE